MRRLNILVSIILVCPFALFLAGALVGCQRPPAAGAQGENPAPTPASDMAAAPTVTVAPLVRGTIVKKLPVTGTLNALRDRQASVTPPVTGSIDMLAIHIGQRVTRGQEIAHLSTRTLQGQIQQALATIAQNQVVVQQAQVNAIQQKAQTNTAILQAESAAAAARAALGGAQATLTGNQAALTNAEQSLARAETLFKEGLVAQKDVEAAKLQVRTARAQVDAQIQTIDAQRQTVAGQEAAVRAAETASLQNVVKQKDVQIAQQQVRNARGALATAQAQLALYTIHAPLTGLVTSIGAAFGETVDTSKPLAVIMNLDVLQLQIAVPNVSAPLVHTGQTLTFQVDALPNRVFTSQIRSTASQLDPATNTLTTNASIPNPQGHFKDNMSARVWIALQSHAGALLAPKNAVFFSPDGKASVVVIGADNVAHTQEVKTGLTDDKHVEILSGVPANARIATSGGYGLPDGTKVAVVSGDAAANAGAP